MDGPDDASPWPWPSPSPWLLLSPRLGVQGAPECRGRWRHGILILSGGTWRKGGGARPSTAELWHAADGTEKGCRGARKRGRRALCGRVTYRRSDAAGEAGGAGGRRGWMCEQAPQRLRCANREVASATDTSTSSERSADAPLPLGFMGREGTTTRAVCCGEAPDSVEMLTSALGTPRPQPASAPSSHRICSELKNDEYLNSCSINGATCGLCGDATQRSAPHVEREEKTGTVPMTMACRDEVEAGDGARAGAEAGVDLGTSAVAEEKQMEADGEEEEEEEDGRAATVGVGTARAAHIAAMVLHSRAGVVRRGRGTGAAAPVGAQCYGTSSRFEPKSRLRIKSIFQPITALLDTDMYADTGILYGYLHRSGALCRYARPASAISRSSRRRPRQWNTWTLTASPQDRRGPPLRRTAVLSRPPPKHICYVRFKGVATTAE